LVAKPDAAHFSAAVTAIEKSAASGLAYAERSDSEARQKLPDLNSANGKKLGNDRLGKVRCLVPRSAVDTRGLTAQGRTQEEENLTLKI